MKTKSAIKNIKSIFTVESINNYMKIATNGEAPAYWYK